MSVRNQTLQEIEIICVNDGTPDDSMEIVRRMEKEDDRIVILEKENGGLSTARNAGLAHAGGEYVYFLDSDDYLVPEALNILYRAAVKNGLDNIYFGADTIYESPDVKKKYCRRFEGYYHRRHTYSGVYSGQELLQELLRNGEYRTSACLQMPRREYLLEQGICFLEGILHEDNLFALQSMLCAERTMVLEDNLYVRRVREASIMTGAKKVESSWGYYRCTEEILRFLEGKGYAEETINSVSELLTVIQRDALWPIRNMSETEISEGIRVLGSVEEQLRYRLFVQNIMPLAKQGSLLYRLRERIRRTKEKQ